jgi:hypothetical protein
MVSRRHLFATTKMERMNWVRGVATLAAAVAAASAAGCAAHSSARSQPAPATPAASSPAPRPTITVLRRVHALDAGQGVDLAAQQGVRLRIRASKPSVSRTRLSSSYGYAPARGYYVTFVVTLTDTGTTALDVGPTDFVVRIAGEGTVTSYSGNAPYSGASEQLDATQIDPGQSVHAPLTFDVRRPHGVLSYQPDGSPAVTWRF